MPELPEVETVRVGLDKVMRGRRIESVEVTGRRSVRRQDKSEFIAALTDRRIDAVARHGKYLYSTLDDAAMLVVHLRMSGMLRYTERVEALQPHTHVVLRLANAGEVRFVDPRTFGEIFVSTERSARGLPIEIAHLGTDPLTEGVQVAELSGALSRRRVALKTFLLDQRVIAGIGSIYADEICFVARLHPDRVCNSIDRAGVARLARAIRSVLSEAVVSKGSSLRDASYRDLFGELGSYQHAHRVYGRTGEPCRRCGTAISRARIGGRSAHFCSSCQD